MFSRIESLRESNKPHVKMAPSPVEANVQCGAQKIGTENVSFDEEMYRVPENISFPEEEEKTLKFWGDNQVFEKCLQQSKGKPK